LKKQKLDKKLRLKLKEPEDYPFSDVLEISQRLYDKKEVPENTKNRMGTIRRCFKAAARHEGILKKLLSFLPNDSYGSVICGGFALVLAVHFTQPLVGST
jgi:hypothetical protein